MIRDMVGRCAILILKPKGEGVPANTNVWVAEFTVLRDHIFARCKAHLKFDEKKLV